MCLSQSTRSAGLLFVLTQISSAFLQQQIQEVFKNQQEQLNMQLLQQKNAGIVSQEVTVIHYSIIFFSVHDYIATRIIHFWIGDKFDSVLKYLTRSLE